GTSVVKTTTDGSRGPIYPPQPPLPSILPPPQLPPPPLPASPPPALGFLHHLGRMPRIRPKLCRSPWLRRGARNGCRANEGGCRGRRALDIVGALPYIDQSVRGSAPKRCCG